MRLPFRRISFILRLRHVARTGLGRLWPPVAVSEKSHIASITVSLDDGLELHLGGLRRVVLVALRRCRHGVAGDLSRRRYWVVCCQTGRRERAVPELAGQGRVVW